MLDEQNIVTAKDIFRKKPEVKSVQNKVSLIKQGSKIQKASSYQTPNANTLLKSDNKRKLEEIKLEQNEVFIDETCSSASKKPKFYCEICDLSFNGSNSLSQHRRTQKHERNK